MSHKIQKPHEGKPLDIPSAVKTIPEAMGNTKFFNSSETCWTNRRSLADTAYKVTS